MVDEGLSLPRMNALPFILLPVSPGPLRLKRLPFNWTVNNSLWCPSVYRHIDLSTVKEVKDFFFFFIRKVSADTCSLKLFSSVVQSCPDSLRPHEPQHARPPCPSPTPGVHPNPCPSSRWCHPTISSSVIPFSSYPQSFPASGSFPMSQLFTSGGQSIAVSASTSVLPMNTQDWSPLGWTGWISLQSKGLSRVFSSTIVQKYQFFSAQPSSLSNSHIHTWPLEKP